MENAVQVISSVGFPIFSCLYLFKLFQDLTVTLNNISKILELMNERIDKIEMALGEGGKST